ALTRVPGKKNSLRSMAGFAGSGSSSDELIRYSVLRLRSPCVCGRALRSAFELHPTLTSGLRILARRPVRDGQISWRARAGLAQSSPTPESGAASATDL